MPETISTDEDEICTCPVADAVWRHSLDGIDEYLQSHWGKDVSQKDLLAQTDLRRWVNRQLIKAECERVGMDLLAGEEETYRKLLEDPDDPGDREQAKARLERAGIDTDTLMESFVTRWAIKHHLKECLGLESPDRSLGQAERVRRQQKSSETFIRNEAESADLPVGGVTVTARIECGNCGRHNDASSLFAEGCSCGASPAE